MSTGSSTGGSAGGRATTAAERMLEAAALERPLLRGLAAAAAGFSSELAGPRRPRGLGQALFVYCVKGRGWCEANSRLHSVQQGDLLVVPPGRPHSCGTSAARPWTVHWVHGTGASLPDYLGELAPGADVAVIHAGVNPQLVRLFNEIRQWLEGGNSFVHVLAASAALGYLLALLIRIRHERLPEDADAAQKIGEAIIYMTEHIGDNVRIPALARIAALSPPYFSALFKSQAGCSPRDYLHLLRIHRACQLLRHSALSIKEIAAQLGYQDPFHFSRQFRAFQGLSPTEYRQSGAG